MYKLPCNASLEVLLLDSKMLHIQCKLAKLHLLLRVFAANAKWLHEDSKDIVPKTVPVTTNINQPSLTKYLIGLEVQLLSFSIPPILKESTWQAALSDDGLEVQLLSFPIPPIVMEGIYGRQLGTFRPSILLFWQQHDP